MNKKTRTISIFLLSLLIVSVYIFLIYSIHTMQDRLVEARSSIASMRNRENDIFETKRAITAAQDDRTSVVTYFVNRESVPLVLEEIEALAVRTGVSFVLRSVSIKEDETPSLDIAFSVTGSFSQVYDYLRRIELLPYYIVITQAALEKEESLWVGRVEFSINSFSL